MKYYLARTVIFFLISALSCSDDEGNQKTVNIHSGQSEVSGTSTNSSGTNDPADKNVMFLATVDNLPTCDESKLDHVYYIGDTKTLMGCNDGLWTTLDLSGHVTIGENGVSGDGGVTGDQGEAGNQGASGVVGDSGAIGVAPKTSQLLPQPTINTVVSGFSISVSFSAYTSYYAGTLLFYTIDGSDPTVASNLYTGAFSLSSPTTVKVFAINPYFNASTVTSTLVDGFEYSFIGKFGSAGSGNGQFNHPASIAIDGNVYVADADNHRIQEFDSNGNYLGQFGTSGSGNGQFSSPSGIAVDSDGNIYVVDKGNDRIQKFDSSYGFLSAFGGSGGGNGQFSSPYGIALDSVGNVYVSDSGNNRIQKFDSSDAYLSQFGSTGNGNGEFSGPSGLVIDSSGNIFVADKYNNRIQKFNSSDVYVSQIGSPMGDGSFSQPLSVGVDGAGNVYLNNSGPGIVSRIRKFNNSGTFVNYFGGNGSDDGQLSAAEGIAIGSSGNIWVADSGNNRVQIIRPN